MVVVNRIEKNLVHGYISTPKYMVSELATATGQVLHPSPARARIQTARKFLNSRSRSTERQNPAKR